MTFIKNPVLRETKEPPIVRRRFPAANGTPADVRTVGVIGLGQVGRALVERLTVRNRTASDVCFSPIRALVRRNDPDRPPIAGLDVTVDPAAFLATELDLIVEATGVVGPVLPVVRAALERGVPVVTANKALVAAHGVELEALARAHGVSFRFEASAAAGIPIFSLAESAWRTTRFRSFSAILNGTTHFVIDQVAHGVRFQDALREARARGFAEPDATDDLSGLDAARKAVILARKVLGQEIGLDAIDRVTVNETSLAGALAGLGAGRVLKPVVTVEKTSSGIVARVAPTAVPEGSPLASLSGVENGIALVEDDGTRHFLAGPGAGAQATTGALIDDLLRAAGAGEVLR